MLGYAPELVSGPTRNQIIKAHLIWKPWDWNSWQIALGAQGGCMEKVHVS
jgi:hypothetical protein